MKGKKETRTALNACLKELRLPSARSSYEDLAEKATQQQQQLDYEEYLLEVVEVERQARRNKRTEKLLRESRLPLEKTVQAFQMDRLPKKALSQVKALLDGAFLARTENVLAFGNPGSGKTHLLCALG